MNVETYKGKEGCIAVLVSHGWGAGWSTWNEPALAYDKRIIELFMRLTKDEREQVAHGNEYFDWVRKHVVKWGYTSVYWGGFADCCIEWVPSGVPFRITEYDGNESIEFLDMKNWMVLN